MPVDDAPILTYAYADLSKKIGGMRESQSDPRECLFRAEREATRGTLVLCVLSWLNDEGLRYTF